MELKADLWFPSIVFAGINDVIDRNAIKQIAQAWRNKEPELAGNSNEGGWHSRSIENIDLLPPNLQQVFNVMVIELDKAVEYCRSRVGFPPLKLQNFWININGPGAYHTLHNHQDAMLSGVFYLSLIHI